jgi:hypothetical protein
MIFKLILVVLTELRTRRIHTGFAVSAPKDKATMGKTKRRIEFLECLVI